MEVENDDVREMINKVEILLLFIICMFMILLLLTIISVGMYVFHLFSIFTFKDFVYRLVREWRRRKDCCQCNSRDELKYSQICDFNSKEKILDEEEHAHVDGTQAKPQVMTNFHQKVLKGKFSEECEFGDLSVFSVEKFITDELKHKRDPIYQEITDVRMMDKTKMNVNDTDVNVKVNNNAVIYESIITKEMAKYRPPSPNKLK